MAGRQGLAAGGRKDPGNPLADVGGNTLERAALRERVPGDGRLELVGRDASRFENTRLNQPRM